MLTTIPRSLTNHFYAHMWLLRPNIYITRTAFDSKYIHFHAVFVNAPLHSNLQWILWSRAKFDNKWTGKTHKVLQMYYIDLKLHNRFLLILVLYQITQLSLYLIFNAIVLGRWRVIFSNLQFDDIYSLDMQ